MPEHDESPCLETLKGQGQSVLVVDDVAEQRKIACMILRRLGYVPDAVACGEEALSYLQNRTVDLVIIDMIVDPGMDSLETFQAIRKIRRAEKSHYCQRIR